MKLPHLLALLLCFCLFFTSCKNIGEDQKTSDPAPKDALEHPGKEGDNAEKPALKTIPKRSKTEEAIQKKKKKSELDTLKPKTA